MEGEVRSRRLKELWTPVLIVMSEILFLTFCHAQAGSEGGQQEAQLTLRKSVKERHYQGRAVEGEERMIGRGDSLWRILIEEKGLPETRFSRYLKVIEALNPHLRSVKTLRAGERIFIPNRPDDLLGTGSPPKKGSSHLYRVKPGDYLYKLLREQIGAESTEERRDLLKQIKKLNPRRKNWSRLLAGETIVLPSQGKAVRAEAAKAEKPTVVVGSDFGKQIPARQNVNLLEQIMGALGNKLQREGEETLSLRQGTVRINRASYPMIQNPKTARKVFLDLEGKIPPSLQTEMKTASEAISVVTLKPGTSLHDAINQLLSSLGFEFLSPNRPVVILEGGTGLQVKGEWMVTAPDTMGENHEVLVISLTDINSVTPDYLKTYLASKGTTMQEILLPSAHPVPVSRPTDTGNQPAAGSIETWPSAKEALVDALLSDYQIPFSRGYKASLVLREGIELDALVDRLFEYRGNKIALLFRLIPEDVGTALQQGEAAKAVGLDLQSLSLRDLISRLLEVLGEKTAYQEHRFFVFEGAGKDKLVITISGFYLPQRSLLITDGQIPQPLQRFFVDKGLRIAYFH